jgi:hypothetical protein
MTIVTERTIKRIPSIGIANLSELNIDVDKDWLGRSILNVGHITPQSDNAFNLGSSTKRFRDLYLAKTSGSILFSDGSKIAEDNANLYWDNTNKRLGIGTNTPGADFDIVRALPTGNITLRLFNNNLTSTHVNNEIRIDFAFRDKPAARIAAIGKGNWLDGLQQRADLAFYTIPAYHLFLERMRITFDGKVGIGTSTPVTLLDINGNLGIGGVEVITSTRELRNTVVRRLYTADETEVFVTGTTEAEVKFHRIVNSSTHGFSIRRVNVIAELKVSGGTGYLKVYIDGVNVITLSTTSTTYVLVKGSYAVSWADDTIHDVSIRLVNNTAGQTTYNRLYECYVDAI